MGNIRYFMGNIRYFRENIRYFRGKICHHRGNIRYLNAMIRRLRSQILFLRVKDLKENVRKIVAEELGMPKNFGHDFDKTHRIGPVLETEKGPRQDVIVRFKSHSTRYNVYLKRKDVKTKTIRITPSLTSKRRKLLLQTQEQYRNHPDVNFIYVNIHGDVKVRFHNKFRGHFVHDVYSMEQLNELMEAPDDNEGTSDNGEN